MSAMRMEALQEVESLCACGCGNVPNPLRPRANALAAQGLKDRQIAAILGIRADYVKSLRRTTSRFVRGHTASPFRPVTCFFCGDIFRSNGDIRFCPTSDGPCAAARWGYKAARRDGDSVADAIQIGYERGRAMELSMEMQIARSRRLWKREHKLKQRRRDRERVARQEARDRERVARQEARDRERVAEIMMKSALRDLRERDKIETRITNERQRRVRSWLRAENAWLRRIYPVASTWTMKRLDRKLSQFTSGSGTGYDVAPCAMPDAEEFILQRTAESLLAGQHLDPTTRDAVRRLIAGETDVVLLQTVKAAYRREEARLLRLASVPSTREHWYTDARYEAADITVRPEEAAAIQPLQTAHGRGGLRHGTRTTRNHGSARTMMRRGSHQQGRHESAQQKADDRSIRAAR